MKGKPSVVSKWARVDGRPMPQGPFSKGHRRSPVGPTFGQQIRKPRKQGSSTHASSRARVVTLEGADLPASEFDPRRGDILIGEADQARADLQDGATFDEAEKEALAAQERARSGECA